MSKNNVKKTKTTKMCVKRLEKWKLKFKLNKSGIVTKNSDSYKHTKQANTITLIEKEKQCLFIVKKPHSNNVCFSVKTKLFDEKKYKKETNQKIREEVIQFKSIKKKNKPPKN